MIKGLHHNAYRCRDSEETRRFYQDEILDRWQQEKAQAKVTEPAR